MSSLKKKSTVLTHFGHFFSKIPTLELIFTVTITTDPTGSQDYFKKHLDLHVNLQKLSSVLEQLEIRS